MNSETAAKEFASDDKDKNLTSAIGLLEKKYGKGAIMSLAGEHVDAIEAYPTGSLGLDVALGIGGLPKGRICEVYGPESSGKTTLALHIAAEVQKQGGTVVFIDAEHALDVNYARKLGVDTSKLLVSQPDCGEQALEIAETLIQSGSVSLVIVDSVAALVPRAEIDGEMDDLQPGMQARLMSKALRKLTALSARASCQVLFINQIRMKIGVMFGSPETTTGGNALKFYASVRLDVRRIGALKGDGDVVLGNRTRVKVVKNKVAPPFRECEFDIIFNEGISQLGEIVDMGVEKGVIDKMGSWFSFRGERLGQGREGAKQFLREHPEVASELRGLILSAVGVGGVPNTELATATSTKVAVTKTDSSKSEDGSSKSAMDEKIAKVAKKKGELNGAAAHS
jgi:recombination protein RecA